MAHTSARDEALLRGRAPRREQTREGGGSSGAEERPHVVHHVERERFPRCAAIAPRGSRAQI
eukprot:29089-Pelagococcus_subviridis.AAC.8